MDLVLKSRKVKFSEVQSFRKANRRGFGRLLGFILVLQVVLAHLASIRLSNIFFIHLIRADIVIFTNFIQLPCVIITSPREVFFIQLVCEHPNFFEKLLLDTIPRVFDEARYMRGYPALVAGGQPLAYLKDVATH